ncbi:hypothetical protein B0H66DRAFT_144769 [Apodospora peruviana]|uniref:Ankyrin repeat protein n=1 Tax=Apodospora peruviana TaxID=516989 RepID=A0AAE0IIT6_9PEZI|nr:hypothetical protein B0H66DRAFT_144769 [Apodospora peruviana]
MAAFRTLPPELLLEIADWLTPEYFDNVPGLAAFWLITRQCYELRTPILWSVDSAIERAMYWGASYNGLPVIKAALRHQQGQHLADPEDHGNAVDVVNSKWCPEHVLSGTQIVDAANENYDDDWMQWRVQTWKAKQDGSQCSRNLQASCLHVAAAHGFDSIVTCLLDNGARFDVSSEDYCACL